MTETNAPPVDRNCMGRFWPPGRPLTYSFEGRFLIRNCGDDFTVVDLFHTRTKKLSSEFSTATIGGVPLKKDDERIRSAFAFDLNTMLILFTLRDSAYLAIGEVDFKRSTVFVKQTTKVTLSFQIGYARWFPLSYPPNLYEGVVLNVYNHIDGSEFFIVKMETNDELQVSRLKAPRSMKGVECSDGVLYGLVYNETVYDRREQIDMVKFSIASGTYVQEPKINWQIVECPILLDHVVTESPFCCIGRKLFVRDKCVDEYRSRIISLDLDTKKWQRTSFEFSHSIQAMHSDGERALIVSTGDERTKSIHRFVFNQPDKLSDLVWLRLKRIFDARFSAYDFILSQLPTNFKHKYSEFSSHVTTPLPSIKSNLEAEVREKVYEEQLRAWMTNHESIARNTLAQLNDVQKKLEECLEMCTELKKKSLNEKSMYNRQQFDGARLGNTVYVPTQSTSQSTEENNVSQRIEQSVKTLQNRVECFSGMFHAALEYYEEAE